MLGYSGKIVVVTGSTQGIGRAIAENFAAEGATVIITGRNTENGEAVEKAIRDNNGNALYISADLSQEADVENLMKQVISTYSTIDVLINNAAPIDVTTEIIGMDIKDIPTGSFDKVMKVGLYGTFWCCKYALDIMEKSGGGVIVNISSAAAERSTPGSSIYSAMKSAVDGLTRGIAMDSARHNVRCNGVSLGFVDNGAVMAAMRDINPVAVASMEGASMMNRLGQADEVAKVVMMLASDAATFVTGSVWDVDGGLKSKMPMSF